MKCLTKNSAFLVVVLLLVACGSSDDENEEKQATKPEVEHHPDVKIKELALKPGEEKIILLPAPLQIATALTLMDVPYNDQLVVDPNNFESLTKQANRAQNLGIHVIDLGYAAVNRQAQRSIDVLNAVRELSDQLGVTNSFNINMIKRFEANQNDVDSLSYLILDAYEKANDYFRENEKEPLGLAILSGSYVEGLYLSANFPDLAKEKEYYILMVQQKMFLDNILMLINRYVEDKEISAIVAQLSNIMAVFNEMPDMEDLNVDDFQIPASFDKTVAELLQVTTKIRASIIGK
jgi:hypothetical protein